MCIFISFILFLIAYYIARHYWEKLQLSKLEDKAVFVTGCDSGFGKLLALKLLENGMPVFAGCFSEKGTDELRKEAKTLKGKLETVSLNVLDQKSVDKAFEFVSQKLDPNKGLWSVVNNAGALGINGPDEWLNTDDYQLIFDLNALGVIRVTQKFKGLVKKSRGRIVTVTSVAGRLPILYSGPYCVSKYACEGYLDVIRQELRCYGVSVHILEPGFFRNTGLLDLEALDRSHKAIWNRQTEETRKEFGEDFYEYWHKNIVDLITDIGNPNPHQVSDAYFHAITARYPRKRYHVGLDAKIFFIPSSCLPTNIQDFLYKILAFLRRTPTPAILKYGK